MAESKVDSTTTCYEAVKNSHPSRCSTHTPLLGSCNLRPADPVLLSHETAVVLSRTASCHVFHNPYKECVGLTRAAVKHPQTCFVCKYEIHTPDELARSLRRFLELCCGHNEIAYFLYHTKGHVYPLCALTPSSLFRPVTALSSTCFVFFWFLDQSMFTYVSSHACCWFSNPILHGHCCQ